MKKTLFLALSIALIFLLSTPASAVLLSGRLYDKDKAPQQQDPPPPAPKPEKPEPFGKPENPEPDQKPEIPAPDYNPEKDEKPNKPKLPVGDDETPFIPDFEGDPDAPDQAPVPTPEPATMVLLGIGLFGVAGASRKMKQRHM
jgi:hypothetical protein